MRWLPLSLLVSICAACQASDPVAPPPPAVRHDVQEALADEFAPAANPVDLPDWLQPADLADGRNPGGFNNCTFGFRFGDPFAHPDAICWERPTGHRDGQGGAEIIREQFRRIHISSLVQCGFGEADIEGLRIGLRDDAGRPMIGVSTVCGVTGPMGTAFCLPTKVTCGV